MQHVEPGVDSDPPSAHQGLDSDSSGKAMRMKKFLKQRHREPAPDRKVRPRWVYGEAMPRRNQARRSLQLLPVRNPMLGPE